MKNHYTIGEFSEMFGLNVQTLRYYDSIGLFQPRYRDEKTSRRCYYVDQVYGLANIRFLRRLGYSLQEIQSYMNQREADSTFEFLKKRAEELTRQLEEMRHIETAIHRKISYTESALQEMKNPDEITLRHYGSRYYSPIGEEAILFHDDSFYLYPTIAFYRGSIKTFAAFLHDDEEDVPAPTRPVHRLPAGEYLCGYHVGPYENVRKSELRLRESAPELVLEDSTINFNIIDQFVEKDKEKYVTGMQIQVVGRKSKERT